MGVKRLDSSVLDSALGEQLCIQLMRGSCSHVSYEDNTGSLKLEEFLSDVLNFPF